MIEHIKTAIAHVVFLILMLGIMLISSSKASEADKIPESAHFDFKEVKGDNQVLVGRLGLKRRFLGTRATPSYEDKIVFHSFRGDELKFSTFTELAVEREMLNLLANGRSLPVIMIVRFETIRVGHDGVNMSDRVVAKIEVCKRLSAKVVCSAAEEAGFDKAESVKFMKTLAPDAEKDGVLMSLGEVYARVKPAPRGSPISIYGINVFNTTSKAITVEISEVIIEQDGVKRKCKIDKTAAVKAWKVEARSWSDGEYEKGKMPNNKWRFHLIDPSKPIVADKKITLTLVLKINGKESLSLTRMVDPK